MTAKDYRNLFTVPPAKQHRVQRLHSPTPSSDEETETNEDEEEGPKEPEYVTDHSTT